jgi:hypothetical protein
MRRPGAIGLLVLLAQLVPAPAFAWFGYLARLSGPGEFKGLHFEMRVHCFDEERDPQENPSQEVNAAREKSRSVGAGWSFCPVDIDAVKARRGSIEIGTSILWTGRTPEYASGQRITLVRVVPAFTWRALQDVRYDVLDLGTGGGVYWLTSPDFEALDGVVLEPIRLDFHAPSIWAAKPLSDPRRWIAAVNFRAAWVTFPAGFEADDFNAVGPQAVRLPAELVPSYAITVNLHTLLQRAKSASP